MRPVLAAFGLLAPLLAGCVASTVDPASAPAATLGVDASGFAPVLFADHEFVKFDTTSATGRVVHAEAFVPKGSTGGDAPDTFPAILIASPYWDAGTGGNVMHYLPYDYWIEHAVPRGYAVVLGDNAGNGGSGGCWDFMGPDEQAASKALVEGITKQPWSNGKVGMIGISYDGMTQIMASTQAPEGLVTVVPVAPLTNAYAGLYMNGVHYGGGWMTTTTGYTTSSILPPLGDETRYAGYADRVAATPPCAAENAAFGNDPTGARNAYYEERDFRPKAKGVTASVFMIQGFLDSAVKPDNAWPYWNDITTQKKLWVGHWYHQFPNATASGRDDMFVTLHRWFDHELKGIENGIGEEPVVDVQDSLGRWRHEASWPPADAAPHVLYLGADALAVEPASAGSVSFGGPTDVGNVLLDDDSSPRFTTGRLAADLHIAGRPTFNATVTSSTAGGYVLARLYDAGDNKMRLVSQGILNLQLAGGLDAPQPLTPGAPVSIGFELYPTDYVVPAGHELVLKLLAQEDTSWWNPDPFLAEVTVTFGGDGGARLTLPTLARGADATFLVACGLPIRKAVPDCYHKDTKDQVVDP